VETSDVVATTAYFVVAEAYANALKHARAENVSIVVGGDEGRVRIEVADDGVGGAAGGLVSVRDRVASLGGELTVVSPAGAGTRVFVEIPDAHRRRG
jgi:signal transduction histidine kinase